MKTGVIYLMIKLELEHDIDEEEAASLVQELEYAIKDNGDRIKSKEIVDYKNERFSY